MRRPAIILLTALALAGCVAPVGPVEVTRFLKPAAVGQLAQGTISVEAAPGQDPESLELGTYQVAVARELQKLGYTTAKPGEGGQVALVRVSRNSFAPGSPGSPVSVGVGGSTGSYGSGVGVGIGLNLSGPPKAQVTTELGVMIQDRVSGETLWEGRARFTVRADAPLASSQLGAAKMAEAMFTGFPGNNGETIEVQ